MKDKDRVIDKQDELYKKVYIKSEADLPEESCRCYFHDKVMGGLNLFTFPNSDIVMAHFINECDWYLQPLLSEKEQTEPVIIGGYWWCAKCKRGVSGKNVTFEELHEDCGYPVTWLDEISGTNEPIAANDLKVAEDILDKSRFSKVQYCIDGIHLWTKKQALEAMQEYASLPKVAMPTNLELKSRTVSTCNGRIGTNGYCEKCYQLSQTTSGYCVRLVENQ